MRRFLTLTLFLFLLASLCACEKATSEKEATNKESSETFATNERTTMQHEETTPQTTAISFKIDKNEPYYDVIKEYENYDIQLLRAEHYVYYDIDGDGTEEFLTGWGGSLERVYSIRNGVAVLQKQYYGDADSPVPPVLFSNGTIRASSADDYGINYAYYRFENGELRLQQILINLLDYEYFRRESDIIPITKEDYERLRKEMEGDSQVVELDWKPLTEYGQ